LNLKQDFSFITIITENIIIILILIITIIIMNGKS
jgi:hypothetical protein